MPLPSKGLITGTGFIDILKDASESHLTGMVRMEKGPIIKVVYLQNGAVAFASSNEKADRLTEVLKRAGKLSSEQIEDAQERLKPNVSLGKTLVELGYITPKDLLWGARTQVESILYQLLFWNEGTYQVMEGPLPREVVSLGLQVPQVIYNGILEASDRSWVLQQIGSPQAVFELTPDYHEKNVQYGFETDPMIPTLNGKRTLEEVAQVTDRDAFEVCKAVSALKILGLVRPIASEAPIPATVILPETAALIQPDEEAKTVSLGQVLQIPTVADLQREKFRPEPEPEEENEPSFESEPVFESEPEEEEVPIARPHRPKPSDEPFEIDEPEAPTQPTHLESDDSERLPLMGYTRDRRKSQMGNAKSGLNWRILALIMGIVALVAIAGGNYYLKNMRTQTMRDASNRTAPVEHAWNPQPAKQAKPTVSEPLQQEDTNPESNPSVSAAQQNPPVVEPSVQPEKPPANQKHTEPAPQQVQKTEPNKPETPETPKNPTAAELLAAGKLPEAAALWRKELSKSKQSYTIQIEIACQDSTVQEAVQMLDSPNLHIVPMDFKGRSCYRILYGMYSNTATAEADRSKLPEIFLKQQAPAQVVPISKLLSK